MDFLRAAPSTLVALATLVLSAAAAGEDADRAIQCQQQSEALLARLESEVVGELSGVQRAKANEIVLDVCLEREQLLAEEKQEAVKQAKEQQVEQNSWWYSREDQPGNERLRM